VTRGEETGRSMTALLDERYALGLKSAAGGCSSSHEVTLLKAFGRSMFGRSSWKL